MLWYVVLCYVMLCYADIWTQFLHWVQVSGILVKTFKILRIGYCLFVVGFFYQYKENDIRTVTRSKHKEATVTLMSLLGVSFYSPVKLFLASYLWGFSWVRYLVGNERKRGTFPSKFSAFIWVIHVFFMECFFILCTESRFCAPPCSHNLRA